MRCFTKYCDLLFQFVHEEALAYELTAYFYLELGEMEQSIEYFLAAHERYHEWGAFGKCNSLFEFVKSSFSPASIGSAFAVSFFRPVSLPTSKQTTTCIIHLI